MQPSRRAFLTGFRTAADPWARFCRRLARCVHGRVSVRESSATGAARALLQVAREEDVLHARALCAETGTHLVLSGCREPEHGAALIVDPAALNAIRRTSEGHVVAQAGALLGDIRQWVPGVCRGGDDDVMLAHWLASCDAGTAHYENAIQGLHGIDVVLATGAIEQLGPFGVDVQRDPLSDAARSVVSQLFILLNAGEYRHWRDLPHWPARYRLDALLKPEQNLAHVWPGSQGTLGWLLAAHFTSPPASGVDVQRALHAPTQTPQGLAPDGGWPGTIYPPLRPAVSPARVVEFEEDVKQIFDPRGVFPRFPAPSVV